MYAKIWLSSFFWGQTLLRAECFNVQFTFEQHQQISYVWIFNCRDCSTPSPFIVQVLIQTGSFLSLLFTVRIWSSSMRWNLPKYRTFLVISPPCSFYLSELSTSGPQELINKCTGFPVPGLSRGFHFDKVWFSVSVYLYLYFMAQWFTLWFHVLCESIVMVFSILSGFFTYC